MRHQTQPLLPPRKADSSAYLREVPIVAISTALGGPIALVRLSGKNLPKLLAPFRLSEDALTPRVVHRVLLNQPNGQPLDDVLLTYFKAPQSFTGEDVVEFSIHGSAFIAHKLVQSLIEMGAKQALPGEFSFRAVKNGKLTVNQAQAVSDLIGSHNEAALSLALEKLAGSQNRLILKISDELKHLLVLSEAGIDFSDQDLDEVSLPSLKKQVSQLLRDLSLLKNTYDRGSKIQNGIKTVILGKPNAGKSTFFNLLLGEARAIVSDEEGTTRDTLSEVLMLPQATLRLQDTAGLRQSQDVGRIEEEGIQRSLAAAQEADLILFLIDGTSELSTSLNIWNTLSAEVQNKAILILNKCDAFSNATPSSLNKTFLNQKILDSFGKSALPLSTVTLEGYSEVLDQIQSQCQKLCARSQGEVLITRLDQLESLKLCMESLTRALSASESDLFSSDIRHALYALQTFIGETTSDDILGKIFSDFCIGK